MFPFDRPPLLPADGALSRNYVTFAIIEAEVVLDVTDALTRQAVDAYVAWVTHALRLPRPLIHLTPGELVTGLELTGIGPLTWQRKTPLQECREAHSGFAK